jgi:glycosyltransferase involved in cell wall biosynthesis
MKVAMGWPLSTCHGWGVYGLNLALQWSLDPEIERLWVPDSHGLLYDTLRAAAIQRLVRGAEFDKADVYLHGLGNDFLDEPTTPIERTIGVIFFEKELTAEALARAQRYPLIVTGSTWNERTLRDAGVPNVRTIFQGVDRTLFHPERRLGLFGDKFAIFSGGKAEWRKGQDLVLDAFKVFSGRHPDALLVTAWQSAWPHLALEIGGVVTDGQVDVRAWAAKLGIDPAKVIDIGPTMHTLMPQIYRECDMGVFPNRAEGGTNLVAMECMACGVPTYCSRLTGQCDLKLPYWIDEVGPIDEVMEFQLAQRDMCAEHHNDSYDPLEGFEWADTAAQLKAACKEVIGA